VACLDRSDEVSPGYPDAVLHRAALELVRAEGIVRRSGDPSEALHAGLAAAETALIATPRRPAALAVREGLTRLASEGAGAQRPR
jgi:hypothetical protein